MEPEFAAIVDCLGEGLIYQEASGQIKVWNQAAGRIFGLSRQEATGLTSLGHDWQLVHVDGSFCPGQDHPSMITLRTGQALKDQVRGIQGPDGGITWLSISTNPVSQPGDALPRGVVITFTDISQRRREEEELRASEERYRRLFELESDAVFLVDRQSLRILEANQAACRIYGYTPGEFSQLHIMDISAQPEQSQAAIRQGVFQAQARLHRRKDGAIFPVEISGSHMIHQGRDLHIAAVRDISRRQAAQQALRASEEKFARVFEANPVAMCITSLEGHLLEVNQALLRRTGYSRQELIGGDGLELGLWVNPADRQRLLEAARQSAGVYGLEVEARIKSGQVRRWWLAGDHVQVEGRERLLWAAVDVTERRRAEEALKLNAERQACLLKLHGMGDQSRQQICDFALDEAVKLTRSQFGYLYFMNPEESQLTVHAWSEEAGRQCRVEGRPSVYQIKDTGLWGEAVRQRRPVITNDYAAANPLKRGLPQGHVPLTRHLNLPLFQGERIVAVAGVANKDEDYNEGDVWQLQLLMDGMLSILSGKRAEEALRESEGRFRSLLQDIPTVAVQGYGPDGTTQYWNQACERLYGYTAQEAIGRNLLDLIIPPEMAQEVRGAIDQMARTGEPIPASELSLLRKDGSRVAVYSCHAVVQRPGRPPELFCLDIDLSERQRAEEERARLEEQLRQSQKMQAVGTLAGGMAHEFNNLLAVIMGYAELAQEATSDRPEVAQDLEQVLTASHKARELIRQLLAFGRQVAPQAQPLAINDEIEASRPMLAALLPQGAAIETHLAPELNLVGMAAGHFNQVLVNLVSNAAQALPQGGRLIIRTQNASPGPTPCTACGESFSGDHVMLSVEDTGQGMDAQTLPRIFEPFFTTKAVGSGTGLGLSVVHGIVQGHGGHILCESSPGQGSRFQVFLPVRQSETATPPPEAGLATILVVDDEPALRHMGQRLLAEAGYEAHTAPSGEAALELYRQQGSGIDLVILDLGMPGMGGQECLRQLLALNPRVKVVVASGYAGEGQEQKALAAGATAFVAKPFGRAQLLAAIRQALLKP
ncbi:MAG: PAS domain S-box protein [Pseudomonadota bacterium]